MYGTRTLVPWQEKKRRMSLHKQGTIAALHPLDPFMVLDLRAFVNSTYWYANNRWMQTLRGRFSSSVTLVCGFDYCSDC